MEITARLKMHVKFFFFLMQSHKNMEMRCDFIDFTSYTTAFVFMVQRGKSLILLLPHLRPNYFILVSS